MIFAYTLILKFYKKLLFFFVGTSETLALAG